MAEADLDGQVRAADPDRWLSSRLVADPALRADLIALYAFEAELSAIPKRVTKPEVQRHHNLSATVVRGPRNEQGAIRFTDVTASSGLSIVTTSGATPPTTVLEVKGGGLGLIDFDSDGDLDLFVPNGATLADPKRTDTFSDGRGIFRFGKPGASFPPGAYVEARLPDGTTRRFPLADPAQRND